MPAQLSLGVTLRDDSTLDSFFVGSNAQAWSHVKACAKGGGESFVYLWGEPGSGVTHLLQGACQHASALARTAVYLPLSQVIKSGPGCLEGLEQLNLVCLDDIQSIQGRPDWEERVFHLFNLIRENPNSRLIIGANAPPKQTGILLPDVVSRLAWGVTFQLLPLSDEQIVEALKVRAHARGLILTEEVAYYLLRRCPRTMSVLYQHLDTLDKASLVAQKKLTIPFVKTTLSI